MKKSKKSFSLLLPVYHGDCPEFVREAFGSISSQSCLPEQIVIVIDGPVSKELDNEIEHFINVIDSKVTLLRLESNQGLGNALYEGLRLCSHPLVARMDADDIAEKKRFEIQLKYLWQYPEIDAVGSWICEFDSDPSRCERIRSVPQSHEEIVRFARFRNPMNHMTVMFRKSAVERAGSYRPMPGFEDYDLWIRMIQNGSRLANIPEVLLRARTGEEMIERRRGWRYVRQEWHFAKAAYQTGFWSFPLAMRNAMLRSAIRLLPAGLLGSMYNFLRKKRT